MKITPWVAIGVLVAAMGCRSTGTPAERSVEPDASNTHTVEAPEPKGDADLEQCQAELRDLAQSEAAPGAPEFESRRPELLGRARGHAVFWVSEPRRTSRNALPEDARELANQLENSSPYRRLSVLKSRFRADKATLRALVLRDGYLYSTDPQEAMALVNRLTLTDLFDEDEIWLQRGEATWRLVRKAGRWPDYLHGDGELGGRQAKLLLGDRVSLTREGLSEPLHRDVQALAHREGIDRVRVDHFTEEGIDAGLRFGDTWVRTLLKNDGARLEVKCLDAPRAMRRVVGAWQTADAPRRQALARLRGAVGQQVHERLPFDRPRGTRDHFSDGQLRPLWRWAYQAGQHTYEHEEETYLVFNGLGKPAPPQMCADFILDSYERAGGSWYQPRGDERKRVLGALDFDAHGIKNRRGVLALGQFGEEHPDLFAFHRFEGEHRVPFGQRQRFFTYLVEHADLFHPGDVVAIHGRKQDGYVHQHAILIEDTDPITGMPHALADQMRWPRRRTWEGIMAEAPKRSLYYRMHPRPALLNALVPEPSSAGGTTSP